MYRSVILILCLFIIATVADDAPTAYQLLEDYNFPMGLLPKGILSYDLDETTGQFHAYLNGSCGFSLEGSYQLKYKSTIGGYIEKNRLTGLSGISVKVLFLWLNIVEVIRVGDDIELSVGIASASFPIDNFFECPQCGCGLDCNNLQISLRATRLISGPSSDSKSLTVEMVSCFNSFVKEKRREDGGGAADSSTDRQIQESAESLKRL